jgi:DNA-directed RNA polymerase I, II, and III subunit RPABC2
MNSNQKLNKQFNKKNIVIKNDDESNESTDSYESSNSDSYSEYSDYSLEKEKNEFEKEKKVGNNLKEKKEKIEGEYEDGDDSEDVVEDEGVEGVEEGDDDVSEDVDDDVSEDGDGEESEDGDVEESEDEDGEEYEQFDLEKEKEKEKKQTNKKTIVPRRINNLDNILDEEDEEYEDENYFQKFNNEINKNYILDQHPECCTHNYEEILNLSKVVKDEKNNIVDPLHKTLPFMTKYEKTRIIGIRAKQINSGSTPFINIDKNIIDGYLIAEMELREKKIPFIIRRPLPNGSSEYWNIKDLELII